MICKCCGKQVVKWNKIISEDGTYSNMYSEECPFCGAPSNFNQNDNIEQLKRQKDIKVKNMENNYVI